MYRVQYLHSSRTLWRPFEPVTGMASRCYELSCLVFLNLPPGDSISFSALDVSIGLSHLDSGYISHVGTAWQYLAGSLTKDISTRTSGGHALVPGSSRMAPGGCAERVAVAGQACMQAWASWTAQQMASQDARESWLYSAYDLFNLQERKREKERDESVQSGLRPRQVTVR